MIDHIVDSPSAKSLTSF